MLAILCAIIQAHPAQSMHELILLRTINNCTPLNSDCQAGCNMLVVAAQGQHKGTKVFVICNSLLLSCKAWDTQEKGLYCFCSCPECIHAPKLLLSVLVHVCVALAVYPQASMLQVSERTVQFLQSASSLLRCLLQLSDCLFFQSAQTLLACFSHCAAYWLTYTLQLFSLLHLSENVLLWSSLFCCSSWEWLL